jgi:ARG/rhodanese/phosphatase superfamily protein
VPPGGEALPLDVFCVEQGRWSSGEEFASGRMMVHPSVREKAAVDLEQTKVWQAVLAGSTAASVGRGLASGVASGTSEETANAGEGVQVHVRGTRPAVNTTSATLSADP